MLSRSTQKLAKSRGGQAIRQFINSDLNQLRRARPLAPPRNTVQDAIELGLKRPYKTPSPEINSKIDEIIDFIDDAKFDDVAPGTAAFYTGQKKIKSVLRKLSKDGKKLLTETAEGVRLAQQIKELAQVMRDAGLSKEAADTLLDAVQIRLWSRMSLRFAQSVRGNVTLVIGGVDKIGESIFHMIEHPMLFHRSKPGPVLLNIFAL